MRNLLKYSTVFILLSIIFSSLAGCGSKPAANTAAAGNGGDKLPVIENGSDTVQKTDDSGGFPPVPTAIAKAEIKMADGKTTKIGDQQGNVVLVNLWATWCGPCIGEMPDLVILQDKYRDKNFKIIGLDADNEDEDKVKAFGQKMKLNYELGWAEESLMGEFLKLSKFSGIPQSFLIDRKGRIRGVFAGGGPRVVGQVKELVAKVVDE